MIPKSLLDAAKAFLCWDVFPDLAIQLVALQPAVAFYYPPEGSLHTIVLFYDPEKQDFSEPLFLLFHEAGHACQWRQMQADGEGGQFVRFMALGRGPEKAAFEHEAWRFGRELFVKFASSRDLSAGLVEQFDAYARQCAGTYDHC